VKKFEGKIAECERAVEALYSHYGLVQEILEALREARETHSWQEIEALTREAKSGILSRIVAVYPERGAVEIDLPERVTLVVGESIEANAAAYYEEMKKYKRKIAGARVAMEKAVQKKEHPVARAVSGKKRWYHRFRWFFTSDGTLVVGGRTRPRTRSLSGSTWKAGISSSTRTCTERPS